MPIKGNAMLFFPKNTCPWCSVKETLVAKALHSLHEFFNTRAHETNFVVAALLQCSACGRPSLGVTDLTPDTYKEMKECIDSTKPYLKHVITLQIIPQSNNSSYSHDSIPPKISNLFEDLQKMVVSKLSPALIITGCRGVIEASAIHLGANTGTLFNKIDALKTSGTISTTLADWAHQIRLEGNEAVHENAGTPQEAEEMVDFTKIFLQYAFELPDRIEKIRQRRTATA